MSADEVVTKVLEKKKKKNLKARDFLSSGSTMVNLATTGMMYCCFKKGHYYWFVGDSASGKTWLALSCLAEACINENFDDYRLIYDGPEEGALMDISKYFGDKVLERLEPPAGTKDNPEYSEMVDDVFDHIQDAVDQGEPFIYILDSMDAVAAMEDRLKAKELRKARKSGRKVTGSYGMQKAKTNSIRMRDVVTGIKKTGSIVIIISQTRDNAGFGSQFEPKTAAGGRALKFYATLEMWTSIKKKIKKTVKKKPRTIGILTKVRIKKNRLTGKDRSIEVPIYYSVGIDDLGSCVDYLVSEEHWSGNETKVKAPEFDYSGSKEGLIQKIEEEGNEAELRSLVKQVWGEIESATEIKRKSRYN